MNERDIFTLSCMIFIVVGSAVIVMYNIFKELINKYIKKYIKFVKETTQDNIEYRKNVKETAEQTRNLQSDSENTNK